MVQILSETPRQPSFGERLGASLGQGFSSGLSQASQFAQEMALQKQKSLNLAKEAKHLEKVKLIETGLGTIGKMKNLLNFSGGFFSNPFAKLSSFVPGSQAQKARGELQSLGNSLIPFAAAGLTIRTQKEFDKYSKIISDPDTSPAEFEGALNGIQDILERSLEEDPEKESKKKREKFSSEMPEHRKKAEQLFKTYGDKEKVREILSREFEF